MTTSTPTISDATRKLVADLIDRIEYVGSGSVDVPWTHRLYLYWPSNAVTYNIGVISVDAFKDSIGEAGLRLGRSGTVPDIEGWSDIDTERLMTDLDFVESERQYVRERLIAVVQEIGVNLTVGTSAQPSMALNEGTDVAAHRERVAVAAELVLERYAEAFERLAMT